MPFIVIAFNVNRLSRNIKKWSGRFVATPLGTWLALKILGGLGRLTKERKDTILRRRDKKNREERRERSPPCDPSPTPDPPATGRIGNGAFKDENIPEKDGRDNANGPVHSSSFHHTFLARRTMPTIDEENQGHLTALGQTKANTFPLLRGRCENGSPEGSR